MPIERWHQEPLLSITGHPDYDTSYVSHRQATKDCLISYRSNRYSVPHGYVGKTVTVREELDSRAIRISHQQERIAEHRLARGKGEMVIDVAHYGDLPRRDRQAATITVSGKIIVSDRKEWLTPDTGGSGLHRRMATIQTNSARQ